MSWKYVLIHVKMKENKKKSFVRQTVFYKQKKVCIHFIKAYIYLNWLSKRIKNWKNFNLPKNDRFIIIIISYSNKNNAFITKEKQ